MARPWIVMLAAAASLVRCTSSADPASDPAQADAVDGQSWASIEPAGEPPLTSNTYSEAMEARSRADERLDYKPVTLNGLTSGDNIYLELTRRVDGAAPETVLCTARVCADWRDAGALPPALRNKAVTARIGTADQVDGEGTVMERGVPAVVDLRIPAALQHTLARSSGSMAELPLTPGVYVLEGDDCRNPANASFRIWNGRGLSGSATKDCRATILSRDGESYRLSNSCVNTYDGSRTPEILSMRVPDQVHFTIGRNSFQSCSMAQVPTSLRKLVR